MVAPAPVLTLDDARRIVAAQGFRPATPATAPPRLGVEIEWHTIYLDQPHLPVPFHRLESAARAVALPGGSRLTFEPGGQVELSSQPLPGFESGTAITADAQALTAALADIGVGLVGVGLLPGTPRPRALRSPRYDAMEAHFDAFGTAGRTMMRQTAAIQVNVDLGATGDSPTRWQTAHALGPLLAAVFANSPFVASAPRVGARPAWPCGWRSSAAARRPWDRTAARGRRGRTTRCARR
jgi:glutamate--cysteine ligase